MLRVTAGRLTELWVYTTPDASDLGKCQIGAASASVQRTPLEKSGVRVPTSNAVLPLFATQMPK